MCNDRNAGRFRRETGAHRQASLSRKRAGGRERWRPRVDSSPTCSSGLIALKVSVVMPNTRCGPPGPLLRTAARGGLGCPPPRWARICGSGVSVFAQGMTPSKASQHTRAHRTAARARLPTPLVPTVVVVRRGPVRGLERRRHVPGQEDPVRGAWRRGHPRTPADRRTQRTERTQRRPQARNAQHGLALRRGRARRALRGVFGSAEGPRRSPGYSATAQWRLASSISCGRRAGRRQSVMECSSAGKETAAGARGGVRASWPAVAEEASLPGTAVVSRTCSRSLHPPWARTGAARRAWSVSRRLATCRACEGGTGGGVERAPGRPRCGKPRPRSTRRRPRRGRG